MSLNPEARQYDAIVRAILAAGLPSHATRAERMEAAVDAIWNGLRNTGVSWVGFYIAEEEEPDDRRLILGPRRDKPACSPIGLQGVCGACYRTGAVQIVRDVRDLGTSYVACDPRDASEIVIPLIETDGAGGRDALPTSSDSDDRREALLTKKPGRCWGVLDLDSWDIGSFDERDGDGLREALQAAGLQTG